MGILPVENSSINSLNNSDLGGIKKSEVVQNVSGLNNKVNAVGISDNGTEKRSDLANSIGGFMNNMASTSSISADTNIQIKTMDKMQQLVSDVRSGDQTQEQAQPNIANSITEFNAKAEKINIKIKANDDIKSDSHTYFDGRFGSIPLNLDGLEEAVVTKKDELVTNKKSIDAQTVAFKQQAQKVIETEVVKAEEASPFKEINFGKESANFNATRVTNVLGSIVSSQANAIPPHAQKLLE